MNTKPNTTVKKKHNRKTLRIGSYSLALSAAAIVVVVLVNLLVGALPSNLISFDVTGSDLYNLSDETKKICAELQEDIVLYHVASSGSEDTRISTLLNRYAALSSHISVKSIDPAEDPTFLSSYTETTPSNNSVLAVSSIRNKMADYYEIYTYSYSQDQLYQYYSTYGSLPTPDVFSGETAITGVIDYVTRDDMPKICYVSGNGEGTLDENMLSYISAENLSYEELNLLSAGAVPEDANCVLLFAPTDDLTEMETEALTAYIAAGGKVILVTYCETFTAEKLPNLAALTASMGLAAEEGLLCEADSDGFYQTNYYLLPTLNTDADITTAMTDTSANICLPYSHGIVETEAHDGKTVTPILSTSSSAYVKSLASASGSIEKADGDPTGTFYVAAQASDDETGGALYWYACPYIAVVSSSLPAGNNALFLANLVSVCGKQVSVSAGEARSVSAGVLTVTDGEAALWGFVTIGLIPLIALVSGIAVFVRRKKQ